MIHSVTVLREKIEEIKVILKEIEEFDMNIDDTLDYFHDNHLELLKDFPFLIKQLHSNDDNTMLEVRFKIINNIIFFQIIKFFLRFIKFIHIL